MPIQVTTGLYNKNDKSHKIHQPKTLTLTLTLNPNPNRIFYQLKLENYGINVTTDKNRSRKVKTSPHGP